MIAAVIDEVAAHRAIGDALGGSDFDDSASDDAAGGRGTGQLVTRATPRWRHGRALARPRVR